MLVAASPVFENVQLVAAVGTVRWDENVAGVAAEVTGVTTSAAGAPPVPDSVTVDDPPKVLCEMVMVRLSNDATLCGLNVTTMSQVPPLAATSAAVQALASKAKLVASSMLTPLTCSAPLPLLVRRMDFVAVLNAVTVPKPWLDGETDAVGKFGFAMYAAMSDTVSLIVVSLTERKPLVCGEPIPPLINVCKLTGFLPTGEGAG